MTDTAHLTALLTERFVSLDDTNTVAISPADLAHIVYGEIDPERKSPALVQCAALLELRQLARAVCRKQHKEMEEVAEQGTLFDFQLQKRYPANREGEDVYVLLECLTHGEVEQNERRLRKEADAKTLHADALRAYDVYKFGFDGVRETVAVAK